MSEDKPKREKVLFDRLKPPARHRKQPADNPHEDRFNAIRGRNSRRSLPEKYAKKYHGKHRKDGK